MTNHIHAWLVLEAGLEVCRGCAAHRIVAVEFKPSFKDRLMPRQPEYQVKPQAKETPKWQSSANDQ